MQGRRATQPCDGAWPSIRVAVLCDFLEEQWPSMDLVGDMLTRYLHSEELSDIQAEQLRPALRWRFSRLPGLAGRRFSWNADRLMNRFADYPNWLGTRKSEYDVFHIVDHSYSQLAHSIPAERCVITCHDLDTFRCVLDPRQDERRSRWMQPMTRRILKGLQCAAHVIAVSETTRQELLRLRVVPSERITVIHNGVHPSCSPSPSPADHEIAALLGAETQTSWLLSVGSTVPRKRVDVLLRVLAEVRRRLPEARLIRVGGFTAAQHQLARDLGVAGAIQILPNLDREQLAAVYRRSSLLLQTSEAEGFGLPLVEAMACSCPVVASDIPVLREVGNAAASYCPVGAIGEWAETVVTLLREQARQPHAWNIRRQLSLERAAKFSWAENARQTAEIYRRIAG